MKISASIAPVWRALGLTEAGILRELKGCGFNYLCREFECGPEYDAKLIAAVMDDSGMRHAKARAVSQDPFADTDHLNGIIRVCAETGISKLVVPLGTAPDNTRREYFENNRKYLEKLLPAADDLGVTLLIEHAGNYQNLHHTHTGMELNSFTEYMDNRVKVNVNIANQGMADITIFPDIRVLGSSVMSVDCSDNFFAMPLGVQKDREDLGLAPLMGFLDFDEVFLGLKAVGYDGEFNLRMNTPRIFDKTSPYVDEPLLGIMPLPLVRRYYSWAYKVTGHMFTAYGMEDEV